MASIEAVRAPEFRAFLAQIENHNTLSCYAADLGDLERWLGDRRPDKLTERGAQGYIRALRERGLKDTTIYRKVATFASAYRATGWDNPFEQLAKVVYPGVQNDPPQAEYLEQDVLDRLVEAARTHHRTPELTVRDVAMLRFLIDCGLASEELVGLDDMDVEAGYVRVDDQTALNGYRDVPLATQTIEALADWRPVRASILQHFGRRHDALFINHHGFRLTRQGLWVVVRELATFALGEAEGAKVTPGSIRRTWITNALEQNTRPDDVAAFVGINGSGRVGRVNRYRRAI